MSTAAAARSQKVCERIKRTLQRLCVGERAQSRVLVCIRGTRQSMAVHGRQSADSRQHSSTALSSRGQMAIASAPAAPATAAPAVGSHLSDSLTAPGLVIKRGRPIPPVAQQRRAIHIPRAWEPTPGAPSCRSVDARKKHSHDNVTVSRRHDVILSPR